ncbi:hypothetical protein ROHU_022686 [Labeo rohita]|uniref:Uncharacterized protein n=1 Tax=Labeo rohita TaxID=84645 RepID=A0A498N4N2_LABRO|nr:hypothetical protein ROHU_022686 [Labeo rohita]
MEAVRRGEEMGRGNQIQGPENRFQSVAICTGSCVMCCDVNLLTHRSGNDEVNDEEKKDIEQQKHPEIKPVGMFGQSRHNAPGFIRHRMKSFVSGIENRRMRHKLPPLTAEPSRYNARLAAVINFTRNSA